jgi:hypothetical protein
MKGITKYGNTNNEYLIANANAENILVINEDERGIKKAIIIKKNELYIFFFFQLKKRKTNKIITFATREQVF